MAKKRARLEVIYDILSVMRANQGRMNPTRLIQKSNLSPQMFRGYIDELLHKELVMEETSKKRREFVLTERAYLFLERYDVFQHFVQEIGL